MYAIVDIAGQHSKLKQVKKLFMLTAEVVLPLTLKKYY